jgi:hypothetical protein
MKPTKLFFALLFTTVLLVSCSDDDGYSLNDFEVAIATVENSDGDDTFFLRLDNNKLLWTAAKITGYKPKDGQRVIANYTILSDKSATGLYDYDVKLNDVYEVLTKGIFMLTPQTADSIGNDSVVVRDIWVGSKYLNVEFLYQGYNQTHFINLVKDNSRTYNDGKVHLEFRHNNRDDYPVYNFLGVASFDISSLKDAQKDSVKLVVHVNVPNQIEEETFELTYKYTRPSAVNSLNSNNRKLFLKEYQSKSSSLIR